MHALSNNIKTSFTGWLSQYGFIFTTCCTAYCWSSGDGTADELKDKNLWETTHTEPHQALVGDLKLRHDFAGKSLTVPTTILDKWDTVNVCKQSSLCERLESGTQPLSLWGLDGRCEIFGKSPSLPVGVTCLGRRGLEMLRRDGVEDKWWVCVAHRVSFVVPNFSGASCEVIQSM